MPKPVELVITSQSAHSSLIGKLRATWREKGFYRITVTTEKKRSVSQNALLHKWCSQVASELGEGTMLDVKNYVKLRIFAPLLCADSDDFNAAFCLLMRDLTEEEKLIAISEVDVTSACDTGQLSKGLELMQMHYASNADAVELEFPCEHNEAG